MLIFKSQRSLDESVPGLITVANWTMAPDGHKYMFFWASRWQIMTDREIPVPNFRSSERWQMIAVSETGEVLAVFPGCQVKAWVRCVVPPPLDCYVLAGADKPQEER